jgi:hypothetical protein
MKSGHWAILTIIFLLATFIRLQWVIVEQKEQIRELETRCR